MVNTNDPRIAEQVRLLRSRGQKERYYHTAPGYNLRMTEVQGAIGLVQLGKLEQFTERRLVNAAFLAKRLSGAVQTPITRPGYRHVYHQYTIRVPDRRDGWMLRLHERGIGTAVHYPLAIHRQPFYSEKIDEFRYVSADESKSDNHKTGGVRLPVTELATKQMLSLPIHPSLTREDLSIYSPESSTQSHPDLLEGD
jgi:perosamine synthetase